MNGMKKNVDQFITADLSSIGGADLYEAVEALSCLSDPPAERLSEGSTLDFKEQWSDEMLKHAAANK
jgi:hypothetical protein